MKNLVKLLALSAVVLLTTLSLTACDNGGGSTHTHSYSTAWSSNATQHWHECSCGDKADVGNHTPNTETGVCTVCNALPQLGSTGPGGGKIFYRLEAGFTMTDNSQVYHYLEAAPADMSSFLAWASSGFTSTNISGTEEAIGTGRKNTALILATDVNAPAAKACKDYSNGGKTDWFLPSKDELNQLYVNRASVGNMETVNYWSSSQKSNNGYAWAHNFYTGDQDSVVNYKTNTYRVRAVRAF
jgi:hypothetical protein